MKAPESRFHRLIGGMSVNNVHGRDTMRAIFICIVVCFLIFVAGSALAFDVAIVYSDSNISILENALDSDPRIGFMDTIDVSLNASSVPLTSLLAEYDVLFIHGGNEWLDAETLGNRLANYVDAGGALVLDSASFILVGGGTVTGRLLEEHYMPLKSDGQAFGDWALGDHDPDHPLMADIDTLTTIWMTTSDLTSGATLHASWDDGENLIATLESVVCINMFCGNSFLVPDGDVLAVNAVVWAWHRSQAAQVTLITPDTGTPDEVASVTIDGDHFIYEATDVVLSGPAVKLIIPGENIDVEDYESIAVDFDLSGAPDGAYDLVITTPAGDTTVEGAFSISSADDDDDDSADDDDDDAADDDDNDAADDDDNNAEDDDNSDSGDDDDGGGCCG